MLGLLAYANSFYNQFLMDDYVFLNNPVFSDTKFILSQWNPYREGALGVTDSIQNMVYYRPMAHMVLAICYATFKNHLWCYHLLNLFVFVLASSLVYLLIVKVSGNTILAFLAGFFYLIHPINGIIVNYISAIVLAFQVVCTLGAMILLLESLERKNNRAYYFLSLVLAFLSLFWNESGVMMPFYIGAVILLFRKDSFKEKVFYMLPYFLIVFSYLIFSFFFLSSHENFLQRIALFHITGWEYGANLFRGLMWYVFQLFCPRGVVMAWAAPIVHDHIMAYVLGAVALATFFLLVYIRSAKEKLLQLAIIWMVIGFAPVCLAAFLRPDVGVQIEPHWFVISSIGFFVFVAYFCFMVLNRRQHIGAVILFILIFAWGGVSHANNQLWADQKTYALYWAQQVPDLKLAYIYLAKAYMDQGNLKESKKYFNMSLSGASSDLTAYVNLENINIQEGKFKEAEFYCHKALSIDPYSANTYDNLGTLYYEQGHLDKARDNYDRALMLNPLMLAPRRGLAFIFLKHAEYQKAVNLCLKNLDIVNDDASTLVLLLSIFIDEKDFANLKKYTYRIINPETNPGILTYLGFFLYHHHAPPELAMDCFRKAMRVAPGYANAYMEAGTLLADLGQYDQAISIWRRGVSLDPSDSRFKQSIARAMTMKIKRY